MRAIHAADTTGWAEISSAWLWLGSAAGALVIRTAIRYCCCSCAVCCVLREPWALVEAQAPMGDDHDSTQPLLLTVHRDAAIAHDHPVITRSALGVVASIGLVKHFLSSVRNTGIVLPGVRSWMPQVSGMRTVTGVLLLAAGSSHYGGWLHQRRPACWHPCTGRMSMAAINTRHSRGSFGFAMRPV